MKNPGIYILTNKVNGKQYVGLDSNLPCRVNDHLAGKSLCPAILNAIRKYGSESFDVEIIPYTGISRESLCAVEKWKIFQLGTMSPSGYNLTSGGDGGFFFSVCSKEKISRSNRKRLADGTHPFSGENNLNKRRIMEGTHNFLGESNPSRKRVMEGIHHFLGGDVAYRSNQKRLVDGTHHFLKPYMKVLVNLSRVKYKIVYQYGVLVPKCYWDGLNNVYRQRKLVREGFFDKKISDTSRAVQIDLF